MATTHKQIVGKYEMGKVLAAGYFDSRMRICTHIVTGAQYVVRIYSKDVLREAQWMWDRTRDAIQVMRTMPKHENIIETTECFETDSSLYILMQMFSPMHITKLYTSDTASGKRITIPLQKTKHYFLQVVRGLIHMHKHGVVHLGVAPDHVMINDREQVKIGYLVSCTYFPRGKLQQGIRGTTHTVAPEILRNDAYDPYLADAWSLGILLYFMLHQGRYPHDGANTTKNILYNRLRPSDPSLPYAAIDLLSQLLQIVPAERMPVENILMHPFFMGDHVDMEVSAQYSGARFSGRASSMNVTEKIEKPHIPPGASYHERAALLIQHTYRAYRKRKRSYWMRRGTNKYINSRAVKNNLSKSELHWGQSSRSAIHTNSERPGSRSVSCREKIQEYDDNHNGDITQGFVDATEKAHKESVDVNGEGVSRGDSGNSIVQLHIGNSNTAMSGNGISSETLLTRVSPFHKNGTRESQLRLCDARNTHSQNLRSMANAIGGVVGLNGAHEHDGVPSGAESFSEAAAAAAAAAAFAHVKLDAGRPCPLCKRMPMQRLGGQEPYKTPYIFENGEMKLKAVDEE